MATLRPRVVGTVRGPVEVAETGQGPVLLVVHGTPGGWQQARLVGEDLAAGARVLLVSRPGYGRTPLRSGRTPREQGALYAAVLDALGIDWAVVLGISGGGPSAYAFAAAHPERCTGLLLCCALRGHLLPPGVAGMRRLAAVPGLWSALAGTARRVDRLRGTRGAEPDPAAFTAAERELMGDSRVLAGLHDFAAHRVQSLHGRGLRNDTRQLLAGVRTGAAPWPVGVRVPTVVLHGDADEVVPLQHGEAYAAAVPGARLEVLAGLGHAVPLFARDRLGALARELLGSG
ncbi:MAG: Alpha/beta hydrolase [Frankiales bacterium]|nr:Alpha/beta hydrolase [Frankiales bacterium]